MGKILIIEDDMDMVKIIGKRLKAAGYQIVIATDGVQGVQSAHNEEPDLIILDLMLPAGDGMVVLRNLRLSVHTWDIPIIIMTAMRDDEYKTQVLNEGVDAYLEKPYDADKLVGTVQGILAGAGKGGR